MTIQTRSKLTAQLKDIEELLVRFKDKCASDIRAAGLAATGDKGAQEGLARGRKAEDRLRTFSSSSRSLVMTCVLSLVPSGLSRISHTSTA
jgi:phosphate transport system protein